MVRSEDLNAQSFFNLFLLGCLSVSGAMPSTKILLNLLEIISYFVTERFSRFVAQPKNQTTTFLFYAMNIFVARLNFKTKREDLEAAFSTFGQVASAKIVKDRETGRSKGFGFVEMANEEEGSKAIAALNETELDGRVIVVKPANPKVPTEGA
jgi:RNA recognition motif-containing protein